MNYLSLILKNIKKFTQHKPLLFTFLIISQIVCTIVIILVCGFVDNAYRSSEVIQEGQKQFSVSFGNYEASSTGVLIGDDGEYYQYNEDGELVPYDQSSAMDVYDETCYVKNLKPKIDEMLKFLGDDFESFSLLGSTNKEDNGLYFASGYAINSVYKNEEDRKFDESTEKIISINPNDNYYKKHLGDSIKLGDKININGEDYTVAVLTESEFLAVPYASLGDDFIGTIMFVSTKEVCSPERCDEINAKMKEIFGDDKEMTSPQPRELKEIQNINLAYGVTAAVILMVLLNISRVYSYVLTYRKKSLAVMSICGASKGKVFLIYLTELLLTLVTTFGIGLLIFHTLLLQPIASVYPNFLESMTPLTYLTIFGIYFVVAALIMSITISIFISKSSVEMERSGD